MAKKKSSKGKSCNCDHPEYDWDSTVSMGGRPLGPAQEDVTVQCLKCGGTCVIHSNDWADAMFDLMFGAAARRQ